MGARAPAVVAGVPGAVLGDEPAGAINAALQQRYDEWEAAYQAFGQVLHDLEPVEKKAWAAAKGQSELTADRTNQYLGRGGVNLS